jgi:hypothetical protein
MQDEPEGLESLPTMLPSLCSDSVPVLGAARAPGGRGRRGCLSMLLLSIVVSVVLTIVLNVVLRLLV